MFILDDDCDSRAREANGWIEAFLNPRESQFEVGARVVRPKLNDIKMARLRRALDEEFSNFKANVGMMKDGDLVMWVIVPTVATADGPTELVQRLGGVIRTAQIECVLIGSTIVPHHH